MKRIFAAFAFLLFVACKSPEQRNKEHVDSLIASADSSMTAYKISKMADSIEKDAKNMAIKNEASGGWKYNDEVDKMTSGITSTAYVVSNELIDMNFPYNGGVEAMLVVQRRRGVNSVLLVVSKGQILERGAKIRFDDGPVIALAAATPDDGDSKYLFLRPAATIISHLKKAKRAIVEAEFFNNGLRQMEFDIEGFKWNH